MKIDCNVTIEQDGAVVRISVFKLRKDCSLDEMLMEAEVSNFGCEKVGIYTKSVDAIELMRIAKTIEPLAKELLKRIWEIKREYEKKFEEAIENSGILQEKRK